MMSQRGSHSVIETFMDRPLTGNYQGNLADVCPVGALTLKPFRFKARVWNLSKTRSNCAECSRGCAVTVEVLRRGEVKRFRPRYDMEQTLHDTKEDHVEINLGPQQHLSYPDLWVMSAIHPFRYRLTVFGREANGNEVQGESVLVCH